MRKKVSRFDNYNSRNDPENYAREKLMLYIPWRRELQDIVGKQATYCDHFECKKTLIELKMEEYEPNRTITLELLNEANGADDDNNNNN